MEATKENDSTVKEIIKILAKEKCTVEQSRQILSFTMRTIETTATVQI